MHSSLTRMVAALAAGLLLAQAAADAPAPGSNPALRDVFTADPAPLVVGDTVYLYVGHDEARGSEMFTMNQWLAYSSKDLKRWQAHGPVMRATDFKWAVRDAWAAQVVRRNGRFYLYTTVQHDKTHEGKAIGVAVADNPLGPFKDARGSALITEEMTPGPYGWNDIDPTVFVDDDGTAWMAWGNPTLHLVKLKPNMTELDGPIEKIALPNYTEGPWLSKRKGLYYLTYASMAHQGLWEHLSYATAPSMKGPWTYRGMITGTAKNSYTIHAGLIDDFKGQSYLAYHNATLTLPDGQTGAVGRRSVALDYLHYLDDGSIAPIVQTPEGLSRPPVLPTSRPAAPDFGRSDARLRVGQFIQGYPSAWRGEPVLASVTSPFEHAPEPRGFNSHGGASRIAQTFVPKSDFTLGRISLYAGDGHGTQADAPLRLALLDLGPGDANAASYGAGADLLGAGEGLALAYQPQGAGLLDISLVGGAPVQLKAGHRYALELRGERNSITVYLRASRKDVYADGAAYLDGRLFKDKKDQPADFAFALYARP
ncbi:glycoside hydrolase family 43 protein [Roseateles sp. LYH14W]|uniref:Family 43 glycosylhydrolase n=1 Tax=Pelomonas parva TaxID=3299032 RepID=A0ABW7EXJ8_9BURK